MFERELGWTGLCIEPNPDAFRRLIKNRSAICLEIAIAGRDGRLPFVKVEDYPGYGEMLSGLSQPMDPRHRERIKRETKEHNASYSVLEVSVRSLASVLSEHRISEIHYLSVDTEENEADVLASIDFGAVMIHVITVEAAYNEAREKLDAMLFQRFDLVGQHKWDLYFINRRSPLISRASALRAALSSPYKPYRVRQFRRLAGRVVRSVYPKFHN